MASSPRLSITLTPRGADPARPDRVEVSYVLENPQLQAGQLLCRLPLVIVGVPGCRVDAAGLSVTDGGGAVPVEQEDQPPEPGSTYRHFKVGRATAGDVRVRYTAPVRVVGPSTVNGPLYDLRAEADGINGAGFSFLALPDTEITYDASVHWDLSVLPSSARGVCSLGEGDVRAESTAEDLARMFFMAGPVRSYPADPASQLTMYWLTEPNFDPVAVAESTAGLYGIMCEFFEEPAPGHRVFVRKHPYQGNGGCGLRRSFVFGYCDAAPPTEQSLTTLLSHETAHNWPRLDGEHADTSWYQEGTAEYYSSLLLYRAGLMTEERYLEIINDRARGYYTNPMQDLTNQQAAERYWEDGRAQRVPYGRGFFYLVDLNAKLQAASGARQSVDDLVLQVLRRQRAGEKVFLPDWADMVVAELGEQGRADLDAMIAGMRIIPAADAFGVGYERHLTQEPVLDLGFAMTSFRSRTVTGLVPGGPADRAGVREGDRITAIPSFGELAATSELTMTVQRGDETLTVSYTPRGQLMRCYSWSRAPR